MAFTQAQLRSLVLVPKITGLVSVIFSGLIVFTVLRDKRKRGNTYHRLLCGISISDISASFWLSLSTWPIPSDSGTLWAVGNDTTCTVQGFFTQLGICSSFYNASLSVYYVLVIIYNWRAERIRKIEWMLHCVPIAWALGTATAGVILDIYGNATLWCFIMSSYDEYRWGFFYVPLWTNILIVTVNCFLIWRYVRRVEKTANRWRLQGSSEIANVPGPGELETRPQPGEAVAEQLEQEEGCSNQWRRQSSLPRLRSQQRITQTMARTRKVAKQSFLYAGAFYINWIALSITRILQTVNGQIYYPLLLTAVITVPMQGLPNFLVYLFPRFQKLGAQNPEVGFWKRVLDSMAAAADRRASVPSVNAPKSAIICGPQNSSLAEVEQSGPLVMAAKRPLVSVAEETNQCLSNTEQLSNSELPA